MYAPQSVCRSFCLSVLCLFLVCPSHVSARLCVRVCARSLSFHPWFYPVLIGGSRYHGPRTEVIPYFAGIGYVCPRLTPYTEFLQEVCSYGFFFFVLFLCRLDSLLCVLAGTAESASYARARATSTARQKCL